MKINYGTYVEKLTNRFNNMAHLVTEDLIRQWFIETQKLTIRNTIIEKPYRELLSMLSRYYSEINSRARADFYYNGKSIGNLNAKIWNYEEKTFSFSVELSKDISRWEKITVYNYISSSILTAYDLFLALFEYTNLKYYNIENTTKLSKITLKNCTFDNINLYEAFVWFCNLTQTCVYINRNDVLEVVDYV